MGAWHYVFPRFKIVSIQLFTRKRVAQLTIDDGRNVTQHRGMGMGSIKLLVALIPCKEPSVILCSGLVVHTLACCDAGVNQTSLEHDHLEVIANVRDIDKEIEIMCSC